MYKKLIILTSILFIFLTPALFAASKSDIGTTTATFLKLGVGARASALGETFVAIADDATAPYWNPAGLIQLKKEEIFTMYNKHFQGINHGFLSYARPIDKGKAAIGLSIIGLVADDIEVRENDTLDPDKISKSTDFAGMLSYATEVAKDMAVGLNVKLIQSKIIDEKSKLAFVGDIGILIKKGDLSIGASYANLGGKLKYKNSSEKETIHQCLKAGVALFAMKKHLLLTLDVNVPNDNEIHYHAGTELLFGSIALRAGYLTGPKDKNLGKKFTGGFGLNLNIISIDYAFVPYGDLDDTHRISLGLRM